MAGEPGEDFVLAPEWVAWAAENLLEGASRGALEGALVEEGVPPELARATLDELLRSPILAGVRSALRRAQRAELVTRLARERSRRLVIEAREGLEAATFFGVYVAGNLPVLLPDFARDWPAVRRWSLDYLERAVGDATVAIAEGRDAMALHERNAGLAPSWVRMRDLCARIREAGETDDFYAIARGRNLARPELAPLLADLGLEPGWVEPSKLATATALWLGPAGTVTPLHHDTSSILFVQVWGRKRVSLVAPSELDALEGARGVYAGAPPDALPPEVKVHVLELGPGETLFIPIGWWHHVRALTPSISLAFNGLVGPANDLDWYRPGALGAPAHPSSGGASSASATRGKSSPARA